MNVVEEPSSPVPGTEHDLLRESIEALSEGIAIFGPDMRLIASNRRYAEMLHPIADLIAPGAHWRDLLDACAARGVFRNVSRDVAEWLERIGDDPGTRPCEVAVEQSDGRVYSASYRPTSFGGFVVTRTDITERRRAEAMLRDREALLATVLDTIPVAVVMTRPGDGRIIYRSGQAAKELGRDARRLEQHFEAHGEARDYAARVEAEGQVSDHRAELRRAEGGVFHASLSGRRVVHGGETYVVSAISDTAETLGKEELLRHVVDACPTPLMMTRLASGEVLYASPEARALFGGPDCTRLSYVDPEARGRYVAELEANRAVHEYKVELQKLNGERFWSAASSRLIRFRGENVIVTHLRDLTGQMRIEAELDAQRELVFQNEKLSAMGELLAGVAHELNNPLSVVVGHAQMLHEDVQEPAARRHTEQISSAADRCARIVKTFLTMARQRPARTEVVSINEIVRHAAEIARLGETGKRVRIDCELAPRLPPVVADPDQLTQVVLNLVINADQAIRGAGRGDRVILRTRLAPDGAAVALEVEDNGPGVPEEVRGRIFEPFFTTKGVGEGTGIGLALCHRIVHSHGGEIRLDARFRDGTRFRITLPASAHGGDAARVPGADALGARAARILIVDDEPDVAELNGEILARRGYDVAVTRSVREAIGLMRDGRFDLVISDLNMPDLDGRDLYEAIASEFPGLVARTGFITGDTMGLTSQIFLEEAGRPFLEKPVSARELCEFVDTLLAAAEARR